MLDLWGREVIEEEEAQEKHKAKTFFDCVNAIQYRGEITPELVNVYNPYMVNKAFQQNKGTVEIANIMNNLACIPNDVQFKFYKLMLPKGCGRSKWSKKTVDKVYDKLLKCGYSHSEVKQLMYVMTDEQIKQLLRRK